MVSIVGYSIGEMVFIVVAMYLITVIALIVLSFKRAKKQISNTTYFILFFGLVVVLALMHLPSIKIGMVMFYNGVVLSLAFWLPVVIAQRDNSQQRLVQPPIHPSQPQKQPQHAVWERPPWMK